MKRIPTIISLALITFLTGNLWAERIPVSSSGLVGDGIVEFVPQGYDPSKTPSLILREEPVTTGPVPAGWNLVPEISENGGKASATLAVPAGTSLYGGGEVTGPLLRNGQAIKLWNTDTGAYGVDGGKRLYQSHPWVLGVRPDGSSFGVIFDTSWKSTLATDNDSIRFDSEGAPFRVYVIERETPQEVMKGLAELTGTMEMPPLWALGYHQCRYSYDSEKRVKEIADNFRQRRIPCDVIWMDIDYMDGFRIFTFKSSTFPDPKRLNNYLHDNDFHAVYMIDPGVKVDESYPVYRSGSDADLWVKRHDGTVYQGKVWPGYCAFPDFTIPETRKWWAGLYKDFLAIGIDGVWNDMNEPAVFTDEDWLPDSLKTGTMPVDNVHRGGGGLPQGPHLLYHNAYGMLMAKSTREGFMDAYPQRRPFVLTRANILGGHRYAATWTGDNWAGWDHLKLSVPMSLTLGLSGQPFNGPDIGGFLNNTDADLWANWLGFGVFFPFVRGHACAGTNDKEPWAFGEEIEKSSRMAIGRRYRLLPYIYTLFHNSHLTGIPVMQPAFFADIKDPALRSEQQCFLLGEDLLVIPAFAENPALPSGLWRTVSLIDGDDTDKYQAELKMRGGSIIPAGKAVQSTNQNPFEPLTLLVCLDNQGKASGELYIDAGDGWGFRDGDYALLHFKAERKGGKVKVSLDRKEGKRDISDIIKNVEVKLIDGDKPVTATGSLKKGIKI